MFGTALKTIPSCDKSGQELIPEAVWLSEGSASHKASITSLLGVLKNTSQFAAYHESVCRGIIAKTESLGDRVKQVEVSLVSTKKDMETLKDKRATASNEGAAYSGKEFEDEKLLRSETRPLVVQQQLASLPKKPSLELFDKFLGREGITAKTPSCTMLYSDPNAVRMKWESEMNREITKRTKSNEERKRQKSTISTPTTPALGVSHSKVITTVKVSKKVDDDAARFDELPTVVEKERPKPDSPKLFDKQLHQQQVPQHDDPFLPAFESPTTQPEAVPIPIAPPPASFSFPPTSPVVSVASSTPLSQSSPLPQQQSISPPSGVPQLAPVSQQSVGPPSVPQLAPVSQESVSPQCVPQVISAAATTFVPPSPVIQQQQQQTFSPPSNVATVAAFSPLPSPSPPVASFSPPPSAVAPVPPPPVAGVPPPPVSAAVAPPPPARVPPPPPSVVQPSPSSGGVRPPPPPPAGCPPPPPGGIPPPPPPGGIPPPPPQGVPPPPPGGIPPPPPKAGAAPPASGVGNLMSELVCFIFFFLTIL